MSYSLWFLAIINIVGFGTVYWDKYKARQGRWRTKESTLLLLAIAGGSLGVYFAMQKFRHKTQKKLFTIGVPVVILIQISLLVYYFIK